MTGSTSAGGLCNDSVSDIGKDGLSHSDSVSDIRNDSWSPSDGFSDIEITIVVSVTLSRSHVRKHRLPNDLSTYNKKNSAVKNV